MYMKYGAFLINLLININRKSIQNYRTVIGNILSKKVPRGNYTKGVLMNLLHKNKQKILFCIFFHVSYCYLFILVHEKYELLNEKYENLINGIEKTDKGQSNGETMENNEIYNNGSKGSKKQCKSFKKMLILLINNFSEIVCNKSVPYRGKTFVKKPTISFPEH